MASKEPPKPAGQGPESPARPPVAQAAQPAAPRPAPAPVFADWAMI